MSLDHELATYLSAISPKQYASSLKKNTALHKAVVTATIAFNPGSLAEMIYIILHGPPDVNSCGKSPLFNSFTKGYRQFCATKSECECARIKQKQSITDLWKNDPIKKSTMLLRQKQTMIDRYGVANPVDVPEIREKIKATNMQRYGAATPFQSTLVQDKAKATNLAIRGVEFPLQSAQVQNQGKSTTVARYGGLMSHARHAAYKKYDNNNPFTDAAVRAKSQLTMLSQHQRHHPSQFHLSDHQLDTLHSIDKFETLLAGKSLSLAAAELGVNDTTIARYCDYYSLRGIVNSSTSTLEYQMMKFLDSLNVNYIVGSKKIIPPLQLDFYLPEYKVAIEVGSIFFHSEGNANRGKLYHWNKWNECHKQGIALYQWFDDELLDSWNVIQSKIRYITNSITYKVGARKVKLGPVSVSQEKQFLEANHVQGFSSDRMCTIGGYHEEQLISVMTFKERRSYIELTRFATRLNTTYPGLFSKMLKHAIPALPSAPIVSFSANCHSNGNVYASSGFVVSHQVSPTYFYTKNYHSRLTRNQFMKSKLLKKYPMLDSTLTEWQLMQQLGYDRIWDAGKIAWILHPKELQL